jgi:hypothetical protein
VALKDSIADLIRPAVEEAIPETTALLPAWLMA